MSKSGSLYIEKDSIFHRLDGGVKFLLLIAWTVFVFMFMDIRIFGVLVGVGFLMLKAAKLPFKKLKPLFMFVVIFTLINSLMLIVITPEYGSELSGQYTTILTFWGKRLTVETLYFALTLSFKYMSILPVTLLFVLTTHPSRFASSLNRVGVNYKVAYAINISLRYMPDVKNELMHIMQAQEARGVAFRKGDASIGKRIKNVIIILIPLVISSLQRIEVISNAMELRGFGTVSKRTWYNRRPFKINDYLFVLLSVGLIVLGIWLKQDFGSFYLPNYLKI